MTTENYIWEVRVSCETKDGDTLYNIHDGFYTSKRKAMQSMRLLAELFGAKSEDWDTEHTDYESVSFFDKDGKWRSYSIQKRLIF